jgi:hypothetical protein
MKRVIHSLTSLYVNVDVNFTWPWSYATGALALFSTRYYKHRKGQRE